MKPSLILLFFAWLVSFSGNAQTVDYHLIDELPKVRTEKIESDGSIWYSYVKQDTFHLDSISPAGQIYGKTAIAIQLDTQQFFNDYWLEPQRGLIVTIRQQDFIYESGHIAVQLYYLNGTLQWESEFTPMQDDFTYTYFPRVLDDSLFLYGYSQYEGDTSWDIGLFNLSWGGDSIAFKWIGFCGMNVNLITSQRAYFVQRNGCSLSGFAAPDVLYDYDSSFQIQKSINFTDSTNGTSNSPIYGKGISIVDENTFHGYTIGEWDNKLYDCLIQVNHDSLTWVNLYEVFHPTINPYLSTFNVHDVNRLDSGYLFYTSEKKWDSTFANFEISKSLIWTNLELKQITTVYTDTVSSYDMIIKMYSSETPIEITVFINYLHWNGTYQGENLKLTINKNITGNKQLIKPKNNLTFYPNPSHQHITVETAEIGRVEIYDLSGERIINTLIKSPTTSIDLSPFKNGIYILKFTSDNGSVQTEKLIISK